jgi:hypothetical protein
VKDQFQIQNIFTSPPASPPHPPAFPLRLPSSFVLRPSSFSFPLRALKWLFVGPPPQIRLTPDEVEAKRRRLALSIGGILLIILIISGIFGYFRRQEIVRGHQLQNIRSRAAWVISQADQLSALSPARAGEMVREERISLEAELSKTKDKKLISSLNHRISTLTQAENRAGRVAAVTPELYLSLELIRPNTFGLRLAAGQNSLGVLSQDNVVLSISMSGRSGEVVAGGDLIKQGIDMAVSAGKTFVLNPENIVEIDNQKKTSAVAVTDEDDAWQNPFRLSAFAGGLFVFDKSSSEIYKYPSIESGGYGSRRRWLTPGASPDFSDVVDMAIDGDIWLLRQDGLLSRFRRGAPAGFKLSGLPDEFVSPQSVSVPTDGSRVWILDNSSRVVAFNKDSGDYAGQWQFSGVAAADLAVSESSGKIFLLSGEDIYVINF